jgi:peptidoglycan/xylan/chitin deacetylase (PgdA/CDA1 family)
MKSPKSFIFKVLPVLSSAFSLDRLIKLTGQNVIFPFYHAVSDNEIIHLKHLYKVRNSSQFINDLDLLLKYYQPLNYEDLINSIKRDSPLRGNRFMLSFDDGLREFHDIIAPILIRKGIPAVCFVNSAFIDNKDLFYRYKASILIDITGRKDFEQKQLKITYSERDHLDKLARAMGYNFQEYLKEHQPYLTSVQIEKLIGQGFAFGAHSIDHPRYCDISEDEQVRQTSVSLSEICERFGLNYRLFSFPFTDAGVGKSFFQKIFDPENPIADLTFGGAGLKKEVIQGHIQRIPFEGTSLNAGQILGSEYLYWVMKAIAGRNRINR